MMKSKFILAALAVALFSCSNNKTANTTEEADTQTPATSALAGTWHLVDFAGGEGVVNVDTLDFELTIDDKSNGFIMTTDCNGIAGEYTVNGDSLQFNPMISTLMECPTAVVEPAMNATLPMITTYTITPDSTLLLRSDARIMATFKLAPAVDLTK